MSQIIKNSIKDYYLAKKYKNQILTQEEIKIFSHDKWRYLVYITDSNSDIIGYKVKVREVVLVEKEKCVELFNYFGPNCITGTSLFPVYPEKISWWKLEKFGNINNGIYEDIEERHINLRIKNRLDVINYLNFLKKIYKSWCHQLELPGFNNKMKGGEF